MNIIAFLIVGILAGLIAGQLVEGQGFGMLGDLVVGVVGALIGGYIFGLFGYTDVGFWSTLLTSVVGAVILLFAAHLIRGTSAPRTPIKKI